MTHIVHPYAHRLINLRDWKSRWFATGRQYQENLRGDILLREYLQKRLRQNYVSSIEFERGSKNTRLIIRTSRPGMIIGRNGEGATKLKSDIAQFVRKNKINLGANMKLDIIDIPNPDADAAIIASSVVEMLEKRMQFRRIMKMTVDKVMQVKGVKGVKITLSGRLGGAEMSRREEIKKGSIPLQFIRADVDFSQKLAILSYGGIGVKIWIHKGDSLEAEDTSKNHQRRGGRPLNKRNEQ